MRSRVANEVSRRQFLISSGVAVAAACLTPPRLFSQQGLVEMALKESATAKITVEALRRNISVLLGPGGNIAVLTGPEGVSHRCRSRHRAVECRGGSRRHQCRSH
jgi:hypothetical protein